VLGKKGRNTKKDEKEQKTRFADQKTKKNQKK